MFDAVSLDDPRIVVRGALGGRRDAQNLAPARLPDWTLPRSPLPAFTLMAAMTSGVRLDFVTTAQVWEIDVIETGLQFEGEERRRAVIDVCCNGALLSHELRDGHTIVVGDRGAGFLEGRVQTLRFDLGPGEKRVEAWLPQAAVAEVRGFRLERGARLESPPEGAQRWAHYGSSISHGMEAAGPARTWPALAARKAGLDLLNLGLAGECHLDGFMARVLGEADADLISLELGANVVAADTLRRRTFPGAVHAFLDTIRASNPAAPILLVSPIHCPPLEEATGPLRRLPGGGYVAESRPHARDDGALTMPDARRILSEVVAQRRREGDGAITMIDGPDLFSASHEADQPDRVHPNANGHETMASRFFEAALQNGPFSKL